MRCIMLLILMVTTVAASAQPISIPDRNPVDFNDFKFQKIDLPEVQPLANISFHPADITVLDVRFDTSTMGFINKTIFGEKRLTLEKGTGATVEHFLKRLLPAAPDKNGAAIGLLAVIQKLWLSDDLMLPAANSNAKKNALSHKGVMIEIAYFLKEDTTYTPLFRLDSVFTGPRSINSYAADYIAEAILHTAERLKKVDALQVLKSEKKYSITYIEHLYQTRFAHPVLAVKPRRGVYQTFEEFRKNKPSITNFSIRSDNTTDNLYCKDESGREVLFRNMFAVSDGKDFYIWSTDNFYKLHRSGNTFNLFGSRHYYHKAASRFIDPLFVPAYLLSGGSGLVYFNPNSGGNATMKKKMRFYQLDMDTGIFH